ncbi:MAG: helix-turn-helix domain-containing protein [Prevotellaceae bacterium]|jgi:transcriptional regulator with XRE-family HTH domain|nr:helix-turn-helix domain-containing protein [Prevotellaceae bacterium]
MNPKRKNILENIAEIRKSKGFSQDYIGNQLGLTQRGYGMIENGERSLEYDKLEQIALIFKMDVIDIITYPKVYTYSEAADETRVLVEIRLNNEEFVHSGIKEKVMKVLNKKK